MATQYSSLTDEQWFDRISGKSGPKLFSVPDEKTQTGTVGKSGEPALRDAFMFYQFTKKMLIEHGNGVSDETAIMDFGCAWGRIIRFWLRDINPANLFGFDVQDRFLAMARRDVPGPNYAVSNPAPALPDNGAKFDLIYAFSVFSHLPAELADSWIADMARVLKPRGIVCVTTRPRAHIENVGTGAMKGAHADAYARVIKSKDEALAKYDAGEFIFYPAGGGFSKKSDYGEAIIPQSYVERVWSQHLNFIGFFKNYSETYLQPCIVLRKPLIGN